MIRNTKRPILVTIAIIGGMIAIRLPLYRAPGVLLGWNSDSAIFGLMARAMARSHRPIFFFWGEDYLGTLTSFWTLLAGLVTGGISPLALRLGATLQVALALTFYWHAIDRLWGSAAATIAVFWLAAGPRYFFELSYAPLSAEQMLLIGSIALWYVTREPLERPMQWAIVGLLAGLGWWAHRGALFAIVPALATFRRRHGVAGALAFACGLAAGLVPWLLGRMQIDQPLYAPVIPPISITQIGRRMMETATTDFWQFGGGVIATLLLLPFFIAGLRALRRTRQEIVALGVIAISFAVWISPYAYGDALRYLSLALPVFLAICALGVTRLPRLAAIAVTVLIAAMFYVPRISDMRAIAAGRREQFEHWPGGFDPRPALVTLDRGDARICYADFWIAYKLEWLNTSGVQFIPYRSVNRTMARSLQLAEQPGPKCFVALDGSVHPLTPDEDARMRAETIAAVARARQYRASHADVRPERGRLFAFGRLRRHER